MSDKDFYTPGSIETLFYTLGDQGTRIVEAVSGLKGKLSSPDKRHVLYYQTPGIMSELVLADAGAMLRKVLLDTSLEPGAYLDYSGKSLRDPGMPYRPLVEPLEVPLWSDLTACKDLLDLYDRKLDSHPNSWRPPVGSLRGLSEYPGGEGTPLCYVSVSGGTGSAWFVPYVSLHMSYVELKSALTAVPSDEGPVDLTSEVSSEIQKEAFYESTVKSQADLAVQAVTSTVLGLQDAHVSGPVVLASSTETYYETGGDRSSNSSLTLDSDGGVEKASETVTVKEAAEGGRYNYDGFYMEPVDTVVRSLVAKLVGVSSEELLAAADPFPGALGSAWDQIAGSFTVPSAPYRSLMEYACSELTAYFGSPGMMLVTSDVKIASVGGGASDGDSEFYTLNANESLIGYRDDEHEPQRSSGGSVAPLKRSPSWHSISASRKTDLSRSVNRGSAPSGSYNAGSFENPAEISNVFAPTCTKNDSASDSTFYDVSASFSGVQSSSKSDPGSSVYPVMELGESCSWLSSFAPESLSVKLLLPFTVTHTLITRDDSGSGGVTSVTPVKLPSGVSCLDGYDHVAGTAGSSTDSDSYTRKHAVHVGFTVVPLVRVDGTGDGKLHFMSTQTVKSVADSVSMNTAGSSLGVSGTLSTDDSGKVTATGILGEIPQPPAVTGDAPRAYAGTEKSEFIRVEFLVGGLPSRVKKDREEVTPGYSYTISTESGGDDDSGDSGGDDGGGSGGDDGGGESDDQGRRIYQSVALERVLDKPLLLMHVKPKFLSCL
jgi:hypothetical protein